MNNGDAESGFEHLHDVASRVRLVDARGPRRRESGPENRSADNRAAVARLRSADIATVADEERGFERYADLRARWDGLVHAVAPALDVSSGDVDVPLTLAKRGA